MSSHRLYFLVNLDDFDVNQPAMWTVFPGTNVRVGSCRHRCYCSPGSRWWRPYMSDLPVCVSGCVWVGKRYHILVELHLFCLIYLCVCVCVGKSSQTLVELHLLTLYICIKVFEFILALLTHFIFA